MHSPETGGAAGSCAKPCWPPSTSAVGPSLSGRLEERSPRRATTGTAIRQPGCGRNAGPRAAASAEVIVLLDSTVLIDYLRGRPVSDRIESVMSRGDIPATTGINVEEVVRGLLPREVPAAEALFEGLVILPIGAEEGWQAG